MPVHFKRCFRGHNPSAQLILGGESHLVYAGLSQRRHEHGLPDLGLPLLVLQRKLGVDLSAGRLDHGHTGWVDGRELILDRHFVGLRNVVPIQAATEEDYLPGNERRALLD